MGNNFGIEGIVNGHGFVVLDVSALRLQDRPDTFYGIADRHRYKVALMRSMIRNKKKVKTSRDIINVLQGGLDGINSDSFRKMEEELIGILAGRVMRGDLGYRSFVDRNDWIKQLFRLRGGEYSTIAHTMYLAATNRRRVAFLSNDAKMLRAAKHWCTESRQDRVAIYTMIERDHYYSINPPVHAGVTSGSRHSSLTTAEGQAHPYQSQVSLQTP